MANMILASPPAKGAFDWNKYIDDNFSAIKAYVDANNLEINSISSSLTDMAKLSIPGASNWDSGNMPVEFGTWTPVIEGDDTSGKLTYSLQNGWYYRMGRVVTIFISLHVDTIATAPTGRMIITGLPFAVATAPSPYANALNVVASSGINSQYPKIGMIFTNEILMRKEGLYDFYLVDGITTGYAIHASGLYITN